MAGVANIQGHMDEVMELIRDGRIDPKAIISHRLPLEEAPRAMSCSTAKEAMKVVLDPTGLERGSRCSKD